MDDNSSICVDANNSKLNVRQNVIITKQYFKDVDNIIFYNTDEVKQAIKTYIESKKETDASLAVCVDTIVRTIQGEKKKDLLAQLKTLCANFNNDLKNSTDYDKYKIYAELVSLCLLCIFVVRLLKSKPHLMYELIIVITSFTLPKIAINIVKQYENKLSIGFNISKYTSAITSINDLKQESDCITTLHKDSLTQIVTLFYKDDILNDDKLKTRMNTISSIQERLLGMKNYMLKTENSNIVTDEIDDLIDSIKTDIYTPNKNELNDNLFEENIPNLIDSNTIHDMNDTHKLYEVNLKYVIKMFNKKNEDIKKESVSRNLYKILVYIQKECITINKSFFNDTNMKKTRWISLNVFRKKFKDVTSKKDNSEFDKFKKVIEEVNNDIKLYVKYLNDDDKVYSYDLMIAAEYDNLLKLYFIISFIYLINYMADVWYDKINVIGLTFLKQRNMYKTSESYENSKKALKDRKKKIQETLKNTKEGAKNTLKNTKEGAKNTLKNTKDKASEFFNKGTSFLKNMGVKMKGGEEDDEGEDDDDDDDYSTMDTDYIQLAIVSSFWLLTYLILYNYLSKYKSELEYNKIILSENTKKIEKSIHDMHINLTEYGKSTDMKKQIEENIYNNMTVLLESYEKCNILRNDYNKVPFPYTIILTNITILILCVLVIWFMYKNMINNNNTELKKEISKIQDEFTELNNIEQLGSQSGGGKMTNVEKMKLNKLKDLRNRLYFIENKDQFNNIITAFCITSFSLYIGVNMFYSTMSYDNMLYSGSLFRSSKCFKM